MTAVGRWLLRLLVLPLVAVWVAVIFFHVGSPEFSTWFSDLALTGVGLGAGLSCAATGLRTAGRFRLVWLLLGASTASWGIGQGIWTYYEAFRGEDVPFPSFADAGYLLAVPLAAAAMILLPAGKRNMAGRARMILDGLVVAASMFLISWIVVLGTVFHQNSGGWLEQTLSLCYPLGDVVIVTIVMYAILRARVGGQKIPLALVMVAFGLIAQSIADSGFTYLTAIGAYESGNPIDTGWFVGFLLIFLAARTRGAFEQPGDAESAMPRSMGLLMPYVAVVAALVTSIVDFTKHASVDPFVSWDRSALIALLVGRQILTLRENMSLTRDLQDRVVEVRASEQRFESLVQQSSDVVTVVDRAGIVIYQSETITRVFGHSVDAVTGNPITALLTEESVQTLENALLRSADDPGVIVLIEVGVRHAEGRLCDAEISITNLLDDPNVRGLVLNLRDVSERRSLERALVHQASHDSLTELANRSLFRERIDGVLSSDRPSKHRSAVLFLDLDGFKELNDSLGHAAGDLLLTQVASRLQSCVRPSDTVARLGGDEFGILIGGDEDEVDPLALAARILSSFRTPFAIEGQEIQVRTSIGIAHADPDVDGSDQLLRNADLAMYRAKSSGGGTIERYDPTMHAQLLNRLQLEVDLRRALGRGELRLHYQPIMDLKTSQPVGLEALLRWQHPSYGLISPDAFISAAEQTGLIQPIGRWVLHEACRQAAAWRRKHPSYANLSVSVNISARQFANDDLVYDVINALQESGLPAHELELEMTESVLFEHTEENVTQMQRLKALGVRLAIDDFGTGYSSLAYLHMFSVDVLKIDRTFIAQLTDENPDAELIRTILRIGQSLNMVTIAEGIETELQLNAVRDLGCELGQGYLFARPLPPVEVDTWLKAQAQAAPAETTEVAAPAQRGHAG